MTPKEKELIKAMFHRINRNLTNAGPGLIRAKRAVEDALYQLDKIDENGNQGTNQKT